MKLRGENFIRMIHYRVKKRFLKRFDLVIIQLKKMNPEYESIKIDYMARKDYILVTLLGNEDLLKTYNDDLCKIPEMSEMIESV